MTELRFRLRLFAWMLLVSQFGWTAAGGATLSDARQLFWQGEYAGCAARAGEEIDRGVFQDEWWRLKIRSELAQGEYATALTTLEGALDEHADSLALRLLAQEVYRYNDLPRLADLQRAAIEAMARSNPRRYISAEDRVALGRFFLSRGNDARQVLELFYDPVLQQQPAYVEAHLAAAELALSKYDFALAAKTLAAAPDTARRDPHYHFLLARAFADSDPQRFLGAVEAAVAINPRHAPSLLLKVERLIDGEQYDEARDLLTEIHQTNPHHPLAWAYMGVLAHLAADGEQEAQARERGLAHWKANPEVDHTLGRKLSDKYRFAEGAAYQRKALQLAGDYLPAKMQLAQDLLRLGKEEQGWKLVHEVFATDGYNVVAHNLVRLHDGFDKYVVLESPSFRVRMESREAEFYGDEVIDLLERARQELCDKYDVEFDQQVVVEIFPRQQDFAVRTFGIPGADGFLGVCFGNVITANSPAALGNRYANWQAVLWHEMCHVVTLRKSRNRMPRWLSEGISVYEERQKNPAWGQQMTPTYRRMILENEAAPVSELSSAFLAPPSALHLQFAYYESAVVVEYLIDNYGVDTIKKLLDDLADGSTINQALVAHVAPLGQLDSEFAEYFTAKARDLAPGLTWESLDLPPTATVDQLQAWLADHPDNFTALRRLASAHLENDAYADAIAPAERLRERFPDYVGEGNAYELLAAAHRGLDDLASERELLTEWAERSADAVDAYFRLMEIGEAQEEWQLVAANAERMLAVNPLSPVPHRYRAKAAEALEASRDAIAGWQAQLEFETIDPVAVHYRLARLLQGEGEREPAKRHVLMALEDAPRFIEAHRLLLELEGSGSQADEEAEEAEGDDAAGPERDKESGDDTVPTPGDEN